MHWKPEAEITLPTRTGTKSITAHKPATTVSKPTVLKPQINALLVKMAKLPAKPGTGITQANLAEVVQLQIE